MTQAPAQLAKAQLLRTQPGPERGQAIGRPGQEQHQRQRAQPGAPARLGETGASRHGQDVASQRHRYPRRKAPVQAEARANEQNGGDRTQGQQGPGPVGRSPARKPSGEGDRRHRGPQGHRARGLGEGLPASATGVVREGHERGRGPEDQRGPEGRPGQEPARRPPARAPDRRTRGRSAAASPVRGCQAPRRRSMRTSFRGWRTRNAARAAHSEAHTRPRSGRGSAPARPARGGSPSHRARRASATALQGTGGRGLAAHGQKDVNATKMSIGSD